jgi:hypothetical protein
VRVTVLFALVLFLVAVAVGLLVYGLYTVSTLPRMY